MVLTGREKATIFLSILGADVAGKILRYLPDELADLIAAGINHLPSPSPEALSEVLGEFESYLALPENETEELPPPRPVYAQPKKTYGALLYERPQMIAFLSKIASEEEREGIVNSVPREKVLVTELAQAIRPNPLAEKIEAKLKEAFAGKIF
ncbi:MAG: hypothetical protein ABIH50_04660 [bacterium]